MIVTKLSQRELSCPPGWKKARENNNGCREFAALFFFLTVFAGEKFDSPDQAKTFFSFLSRTLKNSSSRKRLNPIEQYVIISEFALLQSYSHGLVCHDLKGAWTLTNRRIAFGLLEAYTNAQVRRNLNWKLDKKPPILMLILTVKTMSRFRMLNGKIV